MNLIQQFLEENLSRDLNHQLLSQIQDQNTAVESLVSNLEDMRQKENIGIIENKIKRIQTFLELKKQIVLTLQPLNTNSIVIFDWILNNFVDSSFLYELIKREQFFVQKQLIEMGKRTLLSDNYLHEVHQDVQYANKIIRQLNLLSPNKSQINKVMNRQKIKEIDYGIQVFEDKINAFDQNVVNFNTQMLIFLRKIFSFDEKIKIQFYHCFKSEKISQSNISSSNFPQIERELTRNNSRSHLSVNSHQQDSRSKFTKTMPYFQNQGTPRKFLETQTFEPMHTMKSDKKKLIIENRRSIIDEKKSSFYGQKNTVHDKQSSMIQNKRNSIDWKRGSEKHSQIVHQKEFQNMNKTLSNFNYFRPQNSNMLYATNDSGRQVRLPTKWAQNSRSSISYYPQK